MEEEGWYRLTKLGKENCLKLTQGMSPSELGYDFAEAAVILGAFKITIENVLKKNPPDNQELKTEIIKLLGLTKDLSKKYMDAARLIGEFPD